LSMMSRALDHQHSVYTLYRTLSFHPGTRPISLLFCPGGGEAWLLLRHYRVTAPRFVRRDRCFLLDALVFCHSRMHQKTRMSHAGCRATLSPRRTGASCPSYAPRVDLPGAQPFWVTGVCVLPVVSLK